MDISYGIPEVEHVDTLFTALADTVTGTESMGLTYAQEYAFAVLAVEDLNSRERVTGCEGLFSAAAAGAKKVWEYIQKMVKSIKDFFFGSGKDTAKAQVDETVASVEANKKAMHDGFDPQFWDSAKMRQTAMLNHWGRFANRVKEEAEHPYSPSRGRNYFQSIKHEYDVFIEKTGPMVEKVAKAKPTDGHSAKVLQDDIEALVKQFGEAQALVQRSEDGFKKMMDEAEEEIKKIEDVADQQIERMSLDGCKTVVKLFSMMASNVTTCLHNLKAISGTLARATKPL